MKALITSVFLASALLAGCGGSSGDDAAPATSEVPGSASESIGGFIDYLRRLVALQPEDLEPVDISVVTAPTDEASEPVSVD